MRSPFANWTSRRKLAAVAMAALAAGAAWLSNAADVSTFKTVDLATVPLMAMSGGDKPAMTLALSVEFPTVGAQYMPPRGTSATPPIRDEGYTNTTEYIGYYDAESCYRYNDDPSETSDSAQKANYKRFVRTGAATSRKCADGFSGNFLNWSSSSAIDIMRMALSGGDRWIDTVPTTNSPSLTVLQRAVLPNEYEHGIVDCFFNSPNFPAKKLDRNGGDYYGAVPQRMVQLAGIQPIWVGNVEDKIYFAARENPTNQNWCGGKAEYKLGAKPVYGSNGPGSVAEPRNESLPTNASECASEGGSCGFGGVRELWFGNNSTWWVVIAKEWANCNTATFGSVSGTNKCYIVPRTDQTWPPASSNYLNSEGYFFARVEVCTKGADGKAVDERDYGLCTRYPNGSFKPTGAIQKYAEEMRLAAFGYLLDQTEPWANGAFGGVLRVPMKYVGDKRFNETGGAITGVNPNREWDSQTGVFFPNPDGHAMGTSGVINYLNKFGRTGPNKGRYKKFDPVGELHYEVVRYLQGRSGASATSANRVNDTTRDGFPVFTDWDDPYGNRSATGNYACLRSSIVTIGDINTNDPNPLRFPSANAGNAIPDLTSGSGWTAVARSFENNGGMGYTDGQGDPRTATRPVSTDQPANPNASSSVLIGSAYWAASHDIRPTTWTAEAGKQRPGLRVTSYFFDVNEWGQSAGDAKADFRRKENKFFTAAKYGGYRHTPTSGVFNTKGNPFYRDDNTTADPAVWQKPDDPLEARTYYLAENARKVLRAFDEIFKQASATARSIAGTAASTRDLTVGQDGKVYQGAFKSEDWSGTVYAFDVTVNASSAVTVSNTATWSAATKLDARTAARNIVIARKGNVSPKATDFTWDAITDTEMRDHLSRWKPSDPLDARGADRVAYLRGSRDGEGTTFRKRGSAFGDVVNSGVAYLGAPSRGVIGDAAYRTFLQTHQSRSPVVFAGANDGMLHALDATTGEEVFAFIPSALGPKLGALTSPGYEKQAYVDATPAVAEAKVGSNWKTVLVGGLGGGGRAVYALDVTTPSSFGPGDVLWEFTHEDDADLGFVLGEPKIVKMRTSAPDAATPEYRWFAAVAGGVNNYVTTGGIRSNTGKPAIFLLALDKPAGSAWSLGSNYFKISLPVDEALAATHAPGVLNMRPIFGPDQAVTAIYAGDLHGQVWKFNFVPYGKEDWDTQHLSAFKASSQPLPLFIARGPSGEVQPISMAPSVSGGPIVNGVQTAFVAVGTGKYLESGDKDSTAPGSFYVLFDPGVNEITDPSGNSAIGSRSRLKAGTVTSTGVTVPSFNWGTGADNTGTNAGYYFDMDSGERQISNAVIRGDRLVFGSLNPTVSGASGGCAPGGGGNEYSLAIDTGAGRRRASEVGLLGTPAVFDLPGDTTLTKSDSTGKRIKTVVSQVVQQGTGGFGGGDRITSVLDAGRLSYRYIANYGTLKGEP